MAWVLAWNRIISGNGICVSDSPNHIGIKGALFLIEQVLNGMMSIIGQR
jgi:hypothetical protein